jgi:hypothetical protein
MFDLELLAWEAMLPRLDDGFSTPRFLIELFELKQMIRWMISLSKKLPQTLLRLFRKPLKEISNHYLATIFGALPFVSDVRALVHKFQTVADKVFEFEAEANKVKTMHFQKALAPATFQDPSWFGPFTEQHVYSVSGLFAPWKFAEDILGDEFSQTSTRTRSISEAKYHNTLVYSYELPFGPFLRHFLAELDYFGMNLSISDLWDVIPFTFVIDWFADIGSYLEQFNLLNVPPKVVIYDQCRSVKYWQYDKVVYSDVLPVPWSPVNPSEPVEQELKVYIRWPDIRLPPQDKLVEFGLPEGWTIVIGAALAFSRMK